MLNVDRAIDGTGHDGRPVHVEGTATDVARRSSDGRWPYAVDNPFGTARSQRLAPEGVVEPTP